MLKENGGFREVDGSVPGRAPRPRRPPRFRASEPSIDPSRQDPFRLARRVLERRTTAAATSNNSKNDSPVPRRVLDPLERTSEILFGIIMVLTFTGSIRVADAGREDLRTVLAGASGCNLAWGLVDAAMYLMATFITPARFVAALGAIRGSAEPGAAHRIIDEILPRPLSEALTPSDIELLRQRLTERLSLTTVTLTRADFLGATGVFLLVLLSTFPVIVPLMVVRESRLAMGLSNAVAVLRMTASSRAVVPSPQPVVIERGRSTPASTVRRCLRGRSELAGLLQQRIST